MTDQQDPAELARRFIDLWQDQMSAVARDPEMIDATARWWKFWMTAGLGSPEIPNTGVDRDAARPGTAGDDQQKRRERAAAPTDDKPSRPEAAGAASRDRDADMDELARRVRELEERLATLEPGDTPGRDTPPSRPRRVSSRRRPKR